MISLPSGALSRVIRSASMLPADSRWKIYWPVWSYTGTEFIHSTGPGRASDGGPPSRRLRARGLWLPSLPDRKARSNGTNGNSNNFSVPPVFPGVISGSPPPSDERRISNRDALHVSMRTEPQSRRSS